MIIDVDDRPENQLWLHNNDGQLFAYGEADVRAGPTAAGIAVVAADTGRVLMLQRAIGDESDPAAGLWEFPGGHLETWDSTGEDQGVPYEDPWVGAQREWQEEVGMPLPQGRVTDTWDSPNGVYRGFAYVVPQEGDVPINRPGGFRHVYNPDDPDGDGIETMAWWDPHDLPGNTVVRPELRAGTDWFALYSARLGQQYSELKSRVFDGNVHQWPKGAQDGKGGQFMPKSAVGGAGGYTPGGYKHKPVDTPKGPWPGHLEAAAKPGTALRAMLDDPKVLEAEAANKARGDVRNDPGVSGPKGYSDRAWAENLSIAHSFINPQSKPAEGHRPTAVIMMGRPGAGKSTLINEGHVKLPPVTEINSDAIQERLGGYHPTLAGAYHKRSTDIAALLVKETLQQRMNILYDMTGRNPTQMTDLSKDLAHAGYDMVVIHAKADAEVANKRVHKRFLDGGRYVTPALLADSSLSYGPDESYKRLKPFAQAWHQFDTNGDVKTLDSGSK